MKLLIVASYTKNRFAPFIVEQADALHSLGVEIDYFGITEKGIIGYLRALPRLKQRVCDFRPDIIHAHYGLSGLLANLQRSVPVVTTYHGSDINLSKVRPFSRIAMWLSAWNIFVSRRTMDLVLPHRQYTLLPCGINLPERVENDYQWAMELLPAGKKYVLFAGAFDNRVKNAPLAHEAISLLNREKRLPQEVVLVELKGYNRSQVTALMYRSEAFLMTSFTEGSPQVVKEAMACGCPIVSVDVGDVEERVRDLEGCYVATTRESQELADLLTKALQHGRTSGRDRIIADGLDNQQVAEQLIAIYQSVLNSNE